jgi:hypothetical protein
MANLQISSGMGATPQLVSDGTTNSSVAISTGNIGIGTATPATLLEIKGTRQGGANYYGQFLLTGNADHVYMQVQTTSPSTKETGIQLVGNETTAAPEWTIKIPANSDDLWLNNKGNNRVLFAASGNVGIGTTNAAQKVHAAQAATACILRADTYRDSGTSYCPSIVQLTRSGSDTLGTLASTTNWDSLGAIDAFGVNSNGTQYAKGASVAMIQDGSAGGTYVPARIELQTSDGTNALASGLCVDPHGHVGIGTTSPPSRLTVGGGASVGIFYMTIPAPTDGLIVGGYVGAGTSSPATPLHVMADGSHAFRVGSYAYEGRYLDISSAGAQYISSTNDLFIGPDSASGLIFMTNALQRACVSSGGNVGIGTDTPGEKLEVNGNIKASGGLIISGSTAPGTTVAGMLWYDTTAGQNKLKIRNIANTGWNTVFQNT